MQSHSQFDWETEIIEINGFKALIGNIKPRPCPRCGGDGMLEWIDKQGHKKTQVCPDCGGTGVEIEKVEK